MQTMHLQQCETHPYQTESGDSLQTDSCYVVALVTLHVSAEFAAVALAAEHSDTVTVSFVPVGAVRHTPG
jgi:hypothetical protein